MYNYNDGTRRGLMKIARILFNLIWDMIYCLIDMKCVIANNVLYSISFQNGFGISLSIRHTLTTLLSESSANHFDGIK